MRLITVTCFVLASTAALGGELESGLFCPLVVEPNAALTESAEALQKRFLAVAREHSGYSLLLRKEVEEALNAARVTDAAQSDASLSKVAVQAKVKNAGFVSLTLTDRDELMLQGRVVRDDGKLLKAAMLAVPRGTGPLLDVLSTATERFFQQLNGTAPAAVFTPEPASEPKVALDGKVAVKFEVTEPTTPTNPGTALRVLGVVLGAAGVGATVAGGVVFGGAGTVQRDAAGNIAAADAPRVAGIRAQQGSGLGLITAGAALGVTGIVMALLAPTAPVTAALAPRADGAVLVVEGSF